MNAQISCPKKYDIEQQATLLFEENEIPLTRQEWRRLAELLANSEYDHIIGGDANEGHSVWVSRYYNDIDSPQALNDLSGDISVHILHQSIDGMHACVLARSEDSAIDKFRGDLDNFAGDASAAIATVMENIALSAVLARVCPKPCEKGCRRGLENMVKSRSSDGGRFNLDYSRAVSSSLP